VTIRRTKLLPETYELGPLWLYQEDLQAIATAISELGPLNITCTGDSETYEASDPSDFSELPENLSKVTISSKHSTGSSAATATFGESDADVKLVELDTHATGVLSRIQSICELRRRKEWQFCRRFGVPLALTSLAAVIIVANIYGYTEKSPAWHNQFLHNGLPWLLTAFIAAGIGMRVLARSSRKIVITNAVRASRPRYWERTRDTWVVGVITAVVGAVIGYVLGLMH
jgi:hypothetical protein